MFFILHKIKLFDKYATIGLFEIMHLDLIIHNWRCFGSIHLNIPDRSFVIVDDNGSGKTSILSAFYSLCTGQSWPTTKFSESLKSSANYYGLVTSYPDWSLTGQIRNTGRLASKYQKPNKIPFSNSQLDSLRVFTYLPSDNNWLNTSRTTKLSTLDTLLNLCYGTEYSTSLKQLNKYVKSKNELIKHTLELGGLGDQNLVNILSEQILVYSKIIWQYRADYFGIIQTCLPEFQSWIKNNIVDIQIKYQITDQNGFKNSVSKMYENPSYNWQKLWSKELVIGKTMFGAQRDDFEMKIGQTNLESMFSRGEMRLLVLFIKSVTQEIVLKSDPGTQIFWLLDDVMNELDDKRESIFFNQVLSKSRYYIITSTKKLDLGVPEYSVNNLVKLS